MELPKLCLVSWMNDVSMTSLSDKFELLDVIGVGEWQIVYAYAIFLRQSKQKFL